MKKLGLIILVVIMALGALGAAYATFTSTAALNETVSMGTVIAGVAAVSGNATNGGNYLNSGWYDTVNINVGNAYPGQKVVSSYQIGNAGTLPVKFTLTPLIPTGYTDILSKADNYFQVSGYFTGGYSDWDTFKAAIESVTFPTGAFVTVVQTQTLSSLSNAFQGQSASGGLTVLATQNP
jgi:hypothetical protein